MPEITRRALFAGVAAPALLRGAKSTDIRIVDVQFDYEDYTYRAPLKFGGAIVDRVTLLNAHCTVRTGAGKTAKGFGSMPMGNIWAFPSQKMSYDVTLNAMKVLAGRIQKSVAGYKAAAHPVDINVALEEEWLKAAAEVSRELKLAEPIPKLAALVVASPFDAALHDAFGKVHGVSAYRTYGPEFMTWDLSRYLGAAYQGRIPQPLRQPRAAAAHAALSSDRRRGSARRCRHPEAHQRRPP